MTHVSLVGALVLQAGTTAVRHQGFWGHLGTSFQHFANAILHFLMPFGIWGLAGVAFVDSGLVPIPIQGVLVGYVVNDRKRFVLHAFVAAVAASLGTLLPYAVGRFSGELILLKRINRQRYERLRDRFERQEFLAIMLPAMGPPGTPIKLFELAAGVFEMKPLTFVLAMFAGKFIQFLAITSVVFYFGPEAYREVIAWTRLHERLVLTVIGLLILAIVIWIVRKVFDRRRGATLPIEEV